MEFPHDYILVIQKDVEDKYYLLEVNLPILYPELMQELERLLASEESKVEDVQIAFNRYIKHSEESFDYSYYGQIGGCNASMQHYPQIYEYTDKNDFMEMATRYLWALSYRDTINTLSKDSSIVLYSWLCNGYVDKEVTISEHLKVKISTNFGYGLHSYFTFSVYYKDILIEPYNYVVEYLRVKGFGLSSFDYNIDKPGIDVWHDVFSKIVELHNMQEEDFLNHWVITPAISMLDDMTMLLNHPESAITYYYGDDKTELTSLYRHFYKPQRIKRFESSKELEEWYWSTISDKLCDTANMMCHISKLTSYMEGIQPLISRAFDLFRHAISLLVEKKIQQM